MKLKSQLITGATVIVALVVFEAYSYYHFHTEIEGLRLENEEQSVQIDDLKFRNSILSSRCSSLESSIYDLESRIDEMEPKVEEAYDNIYQ
jgi:predicted nuclease with TOPRIM domain